MFLAMKEFWKSVNIWHSYCQKQSGTFLSDTVYMYNGLQVPVQLIEMSAFSEIWEVKFFKKSVIIFDY